MARTLTILLVLGALCSSAWSQPAQTSILTGQLLLPPGTGSRGVEIVATIDALPGAAGRHWLLFDESGRFDEDLPGQLRRVVISTGLSAELVAYNSNELPTPDADGRVDLGTIDLRDVLVNHRMELRGADGSTWEAVRVALCFGPPPTGPQGETVALGSRQFPERARNSVSEWLVPPDADDIHFLVEFPADDGRGLQWRGGRQKLFGPYRVSELPAALTLE